ncbi:MAG TPA: L-aspartate oxidase [Acidimicrobiales bacterium]
MSVAPLTVVSPLSSPRFLTTFDLAKLPKDDLDVLIVGSGIAGLTVALSLVGDASAGLMTKGSLGFGSTLYAQGGVAVAIDAGDRPEFHLSDTIIAGAGLGDESAVRVLVEEAPDAVAFLEASGVRLDLEGLGLALTMEGGHSRRRVVHSGGDATGAEIVRALLERVRRSDTRLIEQGFLVDILTDASGGVAGALVLVAGQLRYVRCGTVVIASGGYGQLFAETTAPRSCTGDGAAAALRAGARLADLEFVQFHPTTLFVDADPRPLLSEAMRGEGAHIVDADGRSVMDGVHPLGDLAPRDVVARRVFETMVATGVDHLFLDATGLGEEQLNHRFPTILGVARSYGVDPVTEPIPISPACHYTMGGVWTDLDGRTTVRGLFAVGEVASSGVHGANRLASNSLLEGAVFGRLAAAAISAEVRLPGVVVAQTFEASDFALDEPPLSLADRAALRREMVLHAGVIRDGRGLGALSSFVAQKLETAGQPRSEAEFETMNLFLIAQVLAEMANSRVESRGAHFRSDFPDTDAAWRVRQFESRDGNGALVALIEAVGTTSAA